jgi:hypothetical protein
MATTKARAAGLLVVWALLAADLCLSRASLAAAALGKEQREFDYFALALQWPGTICPSTRYCCAINGCCRYVLARLPLFFSLPLSPPSLARVRVGFLALPRFVSIRFFVYALSCSRPSLPLFPCAGRSRSRRSRSVSARQPSCLIIPWFQ